MLKIYHNPRCRKSRAGLEYLVSRGYHPEVIEYLKNPMSPDEMQKLLIKLNMKPAGLVRHQEEEFKIKLKGRQFADHEWIKILLENPRLIRRPIIETDYRAVVADTSEALNGFDNQ